MMNTFSCPFFFFLSFFLMFTFNHFFGFPWCSGCFGLICGLVLLFSFKVWSYCEKREPRARSASVWYKNPFEFVAQLWLLLGVTALLNQPEYKNLLKHVIAADQGLLYLLSLCFWIQTHKNFGDRVSKSTWETGAGGSFLESCSSACQGWTPRSQFWFGLCK